jgi:hypothetical protein
MMHNHLGHESTRCAAFRDDRADRQDQAGLRHPGTPRIIVSRDGHASRDALKSMQGMKFK